MAESAQIKRVSVKHEAIMDFLLANPTVRLADVARNFGVTQAWLSTVIHSDAFQELLRQKQDVAFHETVLPIREKMMAVAHQALDKLMDTLPMETETRTIAQVAEGVLDRLGFGTKPQGPSVVINNTHNTQVNVLRNELEEARKLLGKATEQGAPALLEVSTNGQRDAIALPRAHVPGVGKVAVNASFSTIEAEDTAREVGSTV